MDELGFVRKIARRKYEGVVEKILHLETPLEEGGDSEAVKFRREFSIPLVGFKFNPIKDESGLVVVGYPERDQWFSELVKDKVIFERYQQRLNDLVARFKFETLEEVNILWEYLQTGDHIITHGIVSKPIYQVTRVWEQADTTRRIRDKLESGMSYKEIADYYNKILPPGLPQVTEVKLRQVMSRAKDRLGRKPTRR